MSINLSNKNLYLFRGHENPYGLRYSQIFNFLLTTDAGIVRYPDSAELVVSDCSDLAGAPRSVLIIAVILGHRVVVVTVNVRAGQGILKKI